jgi:hypothetical protein
MLFAHERRAVTTWLGAAGVSVDYQDYYYFLAALGRQIESVGTQLVILLLRQLLLPIRLLLAIDDSPAKRFGPCVDGAAVHRNPTPDPSDQNVSLRPSTTAVRRCPGHDLTAGPVRCIGGLSGITSSAR